MKTKSKRPAKTRNRKVGIPDPVGGWKPRVFESQGRGRKSPRVLVKCGCCDEAVEVYYDRRDEIVEINGVSATKDAWRKILKPILF